MKKIEKDCGPKCRSRDHAKELVNAVTKGNVRQIQLFLLHCHNYKVISDQYGRTVLHMAASCGKIQLLEWLLTEKAMDKAGKDYESGWTALHRSLFYGELACARLLIADGSSLQVRDKEGLTALDIILKDRLPHVEFVQSGLQEVYTWGDNSNFTLGHENEQHRRYPEIIEGFRKKVISIKQVVMSKYHTVFLSTSGQVYTCGHGKGGRLGHGDELTCLVPCLIEAVKIEACCHVASSSDHTVMLMESGTIFSCGLNDCHQLGQIPPTSNSLVPKQMNSKVLKGKAVKGVYTQRFHTVVFTKEAVFTFGLNAGQLGHIKVSGEKIITQPRQVSALKHKDNEIYLVACSDAATAIYTSRGDLYVLHEYQCRKVVSKWLGLIEIAVIGGHLDHSIEQTNLTERGGSELCITMLNTSGKVFLWRETDPIARRCSWSTKRSIHVSHMVLSLNSVAFIAKDGDGFTASLPKPKVRDKTEKTAEPAHASGLEKYPLSISDLIARDEMTELSIEKIPFIHRATAISADRKGRNFAVLQCQPNACLTEIPQVTNSEIKTSFQGLLDEADTGDTIHDCIIKVENQAIAAHKYILASRSDFFKNLFNDSSENNPADYEEEKPVCELNNVPLYIFTQMLNFMYTDTCDILTKGKKVDFNCNIAQNCSEVNSNGASEVALIDINKVCMQSAFAVNESHKSKKGKKKIGNESVKGAVILDNEKTWQSGNPVRLLQETSKKYSVKNLSKRLEAVKYSDGVIQPIVGRHLPPPRIQFDRKKLQHLYDVSLKCADGVILKAHRCVLVARLEYFKSMLASGWIETSTAEPLSIPIPGDIMTVILDYLYTDDSSVVDSCDNAEFLCNILVVADQLLITRLREMCEVSIASQINMKNSAELLELATFYNAKQLKTTCQQFVCLNLAALLESHTLDILSEEVMEELTEFYKQMVPGLEHRKTTPYDGWPTLSYLEKLERQYETADISEENTQNEEGITPKKAKAKKKRNRTRSSGDETSFSLRGDRKLSVCSVNSENSLDLENISEHTTPVHSPRNLTDQVLMEYKEVDVHKHENLSENLSSLNKSITPEKSSLKDIIAEEAAGVKANLLLTKPKSFSSGKKLSQKERKRLAQEIVHHNQDSSLASLEVSNKSVPTDDISHCGQGAKPKAWGSTTNAWSSNTSDQTSPVIQSFKNLLLDEEKRVKPSTSLKVSTPRHQIGPSGDTVVSWGLASRPQQKSHQNSAAVTTSAVESSSTSPQSPVENPWQKVPDPPKFMHKTVSFSEIVLDETKQSETLQKATNKPLQSIQVEEQAIQELLQLYQDTCKQKDARITVERVPLARATPTWAAKQAPRKS